MIIEGEKTVTFTFPGDTLDLFEKDAERLGMTLNSYAFVVLSASSDSMDVGFSFYMRDKLEEMLDEAERDEARELSEFCEALRAEKSS